MRAALATFSNCRFASETMQLSYGGLDSDVRMEPPTGFEPVTLGLRYLCSTN